MKQYTPEVVYHEPPHRQHHLYAEPAPRAVHGAPGDYQIGSNHHHTEFATLGSPSRQPTMYSEEDGGVIPSGRGYLTGEHDYNHEMYGSLRKGTVHRFFSREMIGFIAAVFSSAFSFQVLQGVTRPLMGTQLGLTKEQNVAVQRLVELPMTISFFIGLLSDSYPIKGLRRKGWMVIGLIINAVSVFAIAGVSAHFEAQKTKERSDLIVVVALLLIGIASIGCIITYVCIHTHVIELSQCEPLRRRGIFQADYFIFRRLISMTSSTFNYLTIGTGSTPNVSLSTTSMLLAVISIIPLPVLLKYWKEEHYSLPMAFRVRANIFWKIMQQKAVWRVLIFISFFGLFLAIKFNDSMTVIRNWAGGAANDDQLLTKSIQDLVMLLTILAWRMFFLNTPWRRFFAWAPVMMIFPQLLASMFVAFDFVRDRYLYRTLFSISYISDGITTLNLVVPLTEIIQEGSEGATVGLTLSLQRLISVFVSTNAQGLFRGANFYDVSAVKADGSGVRSDVFVSLVYNFIINAVAFFGLIFLPQQKLDAQQLRMYGGFTKAASTIIVVFSIALFVYSLVINVMTFVPSLSCHPLAGGSGC
ncbi:hypothetical protein Poli38472_006545 [Pythium oligandrum]|uniref:Transmembrane protein n=1 Tax=Pythium oligandrum TaxID=41045 RepID=A0A8K1FAS8_PYTOL|nr:hypothetical protein Poli38472_006545 [Pythium oligandrum]|eukprot:TMW56535.1 hypothetical protein Poli38472_006545 [Pythium oligandrum]